MRNNYSTLLLLSLVITTSSMAQAGNNQVIPAFEVGIPTGSFDNYNTGVGASIKVLFGAGDHAQVGGSTGYSSFKQSGSSSANTSRIGVVPILLDYRYHFTFIFLEPQLGYGIYHSTVKTTINNVESKAKNSKGGFTWAFGAGVHLGTVDLGARYQGGYPSNTNVTFFGLNIGYVFSSARK